MRTTLELKVGDPVVVYSHHRRPPSRHTNVVRVGRKYLYVDGSNERYDRSTGQVSDRDSEVRTIERHEYLARVATARAEMRRFGVHVDHTIADAVVIEIREALANVIPRADEENRS